MTLLSPFLNSKYSLDVVLHLVLTWHLGIRNCTCCNTWWPCSRGTIDWWWISKDAQSTHFCFLKRELWKALTKTPTWSWKNARNECFLWMEQKWCHLVSILFVVIVCMCDDNGLDLGMCIDWMVLIDAQWVLSMKKRIQPLIYRKYEQNHLQQQRYKAACSS